MTPESRLHRARAGNMASRKRPLDTQASVWVLMRSVKVPHGEDWGDAPHLRSFSPLHG